MMSQYERIYFFFFFFFHLCVVLNDLSFISCLHSTAVWKFRNKKKKKKELSQDSVEKLELSEAFYLEKRTTSKSKLIFEKGKQINLSFITKELV